jgi:hypothetical protein
MLFGLDLDEDIYFELEFIEFMLALIVNIFWLCISIDELSPNVFMDFYV